MKPLVRQARLIKFIKILDEQGRRTKIYRRRKLYYSHKDEQGLFWFRLRKNGRLKIGLRREQFYWIDIIKP